MGCSRASFRRLRSPLDAFIGLCAAARAHGNGTMEISARGSLQMRGLNAVSAPLFAAAVAALAIEFCESVPVIADPLPGDPAALIEYHCDRRRAAPGHRREEASARAESLGDRRRRRAHRPRCALCRYQVARRCDSEGAEIPSRACRRCRVGERRSASSLRMTPSMPCWLCSRPLPSAGRRRAPPICCARIRPRALAAGPRPGRPLRIARQQLDFIR